MMRRATSGSPCTVSVEQLTREQLQTVITWALKKDPGVSDREIGRRVGVNHKAVGRARKRLEAGGVQPQLETRRGRDGKNYKTRRKPMVFTAHTSASNEAVRALDVLGDFAPDGVSSIRKLRRLARQAERETELKQSGPALSRQFDLRCCDFRQLKYEPGSVDLMILDPPWHQSKELRQPFAEKVYELLRPGGFAALIYSGQIGVLDFGDVFRDAGFTYSRVEEWRGSSKPRFHSPLVRTGQGVG